jgi:crossover junction endodeoxyribonuclease RuvC
MNFKYRILGIDPGLALIGYSLLGLNNKIDKPELIECGVISTKAGLPISKRLNTIRQDLLELLNRFQPTAAVIELIYFTKNVKTGIAVAHARGVILEAINSFGLEDIHEFTPTHLKQVLFGHGKANKAQIQLVVSQSLGLPDIIKPDDAADATALALAYCRGSFRFTSET